MGIRLVTLGGLHIADDGGELDALSRQHSRVALFIYLAIEGHVSRESTTAFFWPESDAGNARHALRQSLYHLRKYLGDDWIESRSHGLVVTDEVRTDARLFTAACDTGDAEAAVRLYRGAFLDGVHLVDLRAWEEWVDRRRAQYARAFRMASRQLFESSRAVGDRIGAIKVAERWAERDPADDEAQHRLIQALVDAGERAAAIRQFETYARRLESEGLRPLDETLELVERLESGSLPFPEPRVVGKSDAPSPTAATSAGAAAVTPRLPPRRPARAWLLAATLIVFAASVWALRWRRAEPLPVTSSTTVAVLPFMVRGGEAVEYLQDGMVTLLGAALDGAGVLGRADTRAVFAALAEAGDGVADPVKGERVARRLGASMFVLGNVVEAGGRLQVEGAVYRVGTHCGGLRRVFGRDRCPAELRATAVASGAADSVFEIVDALAARLLGGVGGRGGDRLARTAAVTTGSLDAFKAYLRGERALWGGHFERAADAYLEAIALDSMFAVAYYRLALSREWAPLAGVDEAASAAARHADRLSPRDRDLLEAFRSWRAGDARMAERAYRGVLARYPGDVDAWFQLGEIQFHHGPLLGRPLQHSEAAWRRVLGYEPRNRFALTHLARIAAAGGRVSGVDSLLVPFTEADWRKDRRLMEVAVLRAVAAADTARARKLANEISRWEGLAAWRVAAWLTAMSPDPATMRTVMEDLIGDQTSASLRADMHWFQSLVELAGGRSRSARAALGRAVGVERTAPRAQRRDGFAPATRWWAATLPLPYHEASLRRMRRSTALSEGPPTGGRPPLLNEVGLGARVPLEPLRQYTIGVLSLRLGDTASAEAAAGALRHHASSDSATSLVRDLDRGLRARLAWASARPEEALLLLEALESTDTQGDVAVVPFVSRANERFLRAELLASQGRDAEALRWFASIGHASVTEIPLRALARLRQAEIHDRLGNRGSATAHYEGFLRLWRSADPEFQQLVDAVRRRLETLTRPDSSGGRGLPVGDESRPEPRGLAPDATHP